MVSKGIEVKCKDNHDRNTILNSLRLGLTATAFSIVATGLVDIEQKDLSREENALLYACRLGHFEWGNFMRHIYLNFE